MTKTLLLIAHWDEFWGPCYVCPFCNETKLNDDFNFCPICGKSVKEYKYEAVTEYQ